MSWTHQDTSSKCLHGPDGKKWYWQLECGFSENGKLFERVFFWDETKSKTGMIEFKGDQAIHFSRLKQRVQKLVKNREYRERFTCPLRFLRSGRVEPA